MSTFKFECKNFVIIEACEFELYTSTNAATINKYLHTRTPTLLNLLLESSEVDIQLVEMF